MTLRQTLVLRLGSELTAEFAAYTMAKRAVEPAGKRVAGGRTIGGLVLVGHFIRGLGGLVGGVRGALHRGGGGGRLLSSKNWLEGEDDFFNAVFASAKLFKSAQNVVQFVIRGVKGYAVDFSGVLHIDLQCRIFTGEFSMIRKVSKSFLLQLLG